MRKAARRVRSPWKDEDDALQELSDLVSGLKSPPIGSTEGEAEQKTDRPNTS